MVEETVVMVAVLQLQEGGFLTALDLIFAGFEPIVPTVLVAKPRVS
jgi:hypothetical protein